MRILNAYAKAPKPIAGLSIIAKLDGMAKTRTQDVPWATQFDSNEPAHQEGQRKGITMQTHALIRPTKGWLLVTVLVMALAADAAVAAEKYSANQRAQTKIVFQRIAVAPFLVGHRQPKIDEAMDQTLSCPIGEICLDDPNIMPHAGRTLTRLVDQQLRSRFGRQVVEREDVLMPTPPSR